MSAGAGNTDPMYFNYITYNLSVCWMLADAGEISLYIYSFFRDRFLCYGCSWMTYTSFLNVVFLSNYQLKQPGKIWLLFPFNLSVLLVFSSFSITVSSFVFPVTADVKLICIYHLTFNIYWDVPQLEQLTFCCRQNQNYIVCVLCGWLGWLPFTSTQLFRFVVRQFYILCLHNMPLILDPGLGSCSSLLPGVDVHWGSRERAGLEVSMVKRMEI